MWICFNDGFLSVVADKNNPARLMVRARRKQDLLNACRNDVEVLKDAGTDYRWRAFVERKAFSALVTARIDKIDYTNFKNSVKDHDLHDMYMDFWSRHHRYQEKDKNHSTGR
jgi:hypothetical protein